MNQKSQKFLLSLARQTIIDYFTVGKKTKIAASDLPDQELAEKRATFVTLTKAGELRGCIGNLVSKRKVYEDVINNSLLAAFGDPRFEPVKQDELSKIKIEISILSKAEPLLCDSADELLGKIESGKHGIILQQDYCQATFLPQVWEDLPDKVEFFEALCQKAGLDKSAWQKPECEIFYYTVEKFSE